MRKESFSFQNRHGLKIVGDICHPENSKGLAFVQHGLTSARNRPHIQLLAEILCEENYTTVTFDCTHGFGESGGKIEEVTQTSYIQDLEDVVSYIETTSSYKEPFILAGHSMGGLSVLHYTLKHSEKVKAVAPLSTVISGKLRIEAYEKFQPEELKEWKNIGYQEREDRFNPGVKVKLPWALMENWLQYDILDDCSQINCPVLLVVGEKDLSTPAYQQQLLIEKISGPKELVIIPNCEHTFRNPDELQALEDAFKPWLSALS